MNIEICNYTKKLSKNLVLENINLSLSGGKIYGFVGKNGSGKTMLMRAICGLILPTSGFVKINNKIIGKDISFPDSVGALIDLDMIEDKDVSNTYLTDAYFGPVG